MGVEKVESDDEIVALIAYLQRLGRGPQPLVPAPPAEEAAPVETAAAQTEPEAAAEAAPAGQ